MPRLLLEGPHNIGRAFRTTVERYIHNLFPFKMILYRWFGRLNATFLTANMPGRVAADSDSISCEVDDGIRVE